MELNHFDLTPFSALVGIRTPNLLIRSEMLYPIELQMHFRLLTDCKSMICDLNSQLYLKKNRLLLYNIIAL